MGSAQVDLRALILNLFENIVYIEFPAASL